MSVVAISRSRVFRKSISAQEKVLRIYTSMHSGGLELLTKKLTYTRLEDNQIRHRGDRHEPDIGRRLPLELQQQCTTRSSYLAYMYLVDG